MDHLSTAIRAALEAGKAIMEIYTTSDFGVTYKDDESPLTKADEASDKIIFHHLQPTGIPILSEEGARLDPAEREKWTHCWIVDPLDGTKEFIRRNGEFTVNIALVENGNPVSGIVYQPANGNLYFSENGKAYKLEKADLHVAPAIAALSLRDIRALPLQPLPGTFTMVGSRSHSSPETEAYVKEMEAKHGKVDFIAAGSSLKFCLLAEGKAHAYPRFAPTMEWDTAAGQAVLEAAGGKVVTWPDQQPLRYNREELRNPWFLATI